MNVNKNRKCPLLINPLPECYCLRSQSIWISKIVEFCGGRFEACEYYRLEEGDKSKSHDDQKDTMSDQGLNGSLILRS